MTDKPKLIIHSASSSSNVWTLKNNLEYALTVEMDGMVMNGASSWNLMKPGAVISAEDTANQMSGFEDFNAVRHNYFLVQTDDPGDVFDDAAWSQVIENFRTVAEQAREAGYKGLIFDNEEYGGMWQNYPEHYENADPSNQLAYQNQAALRGEQINTAINEVFPDAEMGVMHGPYMSVSQEGQPSAITGQGGAATRHELRGPFFTGLAEGLGPDQTLIDMGELYALRSAEDFQQSQDYRSDVIPDLFDWSVSDAVRENWDELVTQSHMLITTEFPVGFEMTPDILEQTLFNAYQHSEDVVFIFSNPGEEDWFTEGALDPAWLTAVANANFAAEAHFTQTDETVPETQDNPVTDTPPSDEVVTSAFGNGLLVVGTDNKDYLTATNEADLIMGAGGNDEMAGGSGDDAFFGGLGNDTIWGGAGDDTLNGGAHGDFLYGGGGLDTLNGNTGDDNLFGMWGDDVINGGAGEDWIRGGDGDDVIHGGAGQDYLWGDAGADTFVFANGHGGTEIRDFELGLDLIEIEGQTFDALDISQEGDNTVIRFEDVRIGIQNVDAEDLSSDDFIF